MKKSILFLFLVAITGATFAQVKSTTSAIVAFDATTPKDAFPKAENKTVVASINTANGEVKFEATIKNFTFANPTIQEHFNSNKWMDSEKFKTSVFEGKIANLKKVDFKKDGTYTAELKGKLTIHGVSKKVKTNATMVVKGGAVTTTADFSVKVEDYGIKSPIIGEKIAKEPKISVKADMK